MSRRQAVCGCQAVEGNGLVPATRWRRVRVPFVAFAAVLLAVPVVGANTVANQSSTGAFVVQEWDLFNFWVNGTAARDLVADWSASATSDAEALGITIYKPGVWDAQCPPNRANCQFVQRPQDIYAQASTCPGLNAGRVGGPLPAAMPAGRYHVVVEGIFGESVPYKVSSLNHALTKNDSTRLTVAVFVPPC